MDSAAETVRAFPEFGDRLDANEALDVLCSRKCINPFLDMESFDEEISNEDRKLETARAEVTESLRYLSEIFPVLWIIIFPAIRIQILIPLYAVVLGLR